jgi:hypothetical protein
VCVPSVLRVDLCVRDAIDGRLNLDKSGNLTNLKTHLQTKQRRTRVRGRADVGRRRLLQRMLCFRVFDRCRRRVPTRRCYLPAVF